MGHHGELVITLANTTQGTSAAESHLRAFLGKDEETMSDPKIPPLHPPAPTPIASILGQQPGKIISTCIRTAKGGYLLAVDGGGVGSPDSGLGATALRTDATSPSKQEIFTVVRIKESETSCALLTSNGHYVTAVDGGGQGAGDTTLLPLPILTNGTFLQAGTVFHMILLGEDKVRLATSDLKHYVTAVQGGGICERGDPICTNSKSVGADERFELVWVLLLSETHNGPPS
jgi:hypothetical protein